MFRIPRSVFALLAAGACAILFEQPARSQSTTADQRACTVPAPTSLAASVRGTFVVLTWRAAPGSPTSYMIEAGSTPGASDVASKDTGTSAVSYSDTVTSGTYYVRVRTRSACGLSDPSNEIVVVSGVYQDHPDILVARGTAGRNTYFPSVAKLANGQLLVVYYDSPAHTSPTGRIALVRSRDLGRTWSAPEIVVDTPLDDRDPSITVTRRGRILLSYFVHDDNAVPSSSEVFVIRSDDDGATWSRPAPVATLMTGAATSSRIVELADGDLLIPIYGGEYEGSKQRAAIVRSRDGGLTWPRDQEVVIASALEVSYQEPALADLGGRLLAFMRGDSDNNAAYESRSLDGGRTWSAPVPIGLAAQASDLLPLATDARRTTSAVHAWGDWSRKYGDSRPTLAQVVRWPEGAGALVFGEPTVVYNGHCDDASYPSSVLLDDGRLFVVFYDACLGYIGGAYIPIDALQ